MTKEKKKFQPLTSKHICETYKLLHSEGLVAFSVTGDAENKIEALVSNINGSNFGIQNYERDTEKVVAYLYFLIKNHPFVDGNKRTAVLCFMILCSLNNLHKHLKGYDLDALAVFLEQISSDDYKHVIAVVAKEIFEENPQNQN
ncbi:Fic family protein [Candidatus Kaiserbacteria bacterium]|nr:Fic family protein [Candidatus Kaiserbacteria bacterium]